MTLKSFGLAVVVLRNAKPIQGSISAQKINCKSCSTLFSLIEDCSYADDTSVVVWERELHLLDEDILECINKLKIWFSANSLKLNENKTNIIKFERQTLKADEGNKFAKFLAFTMPAACDDIRERKNNVRRQIKQNLKEISLVEKVRQTFVVNESLINSAAFKQAKRVAIYVSMKNEIGTYDILKEALKGDKKVYIPMVDAENMKMVKINSFNELHMMPKTKWGIIEPLQSDGREDCLQTGGVEYVLVPGMAFTPTGLRLGHGRGYYDRFLALNNKVTNSKCVTVGLGFNEQIVEDLPVSDTDFKLSQVIYPSICNVEIPTKLPSVPEPFSI